MRRFPDIMKIIFCVCCIAGMLNNVYADEEAEKAMQDITRDLAGDPDDPALLKSYAEIATWNGRYNEAIASYRKLLQQQPDNDAIVLALARVESWQGELDAAALHFDSYITRNPNDKEALLGYAYNESWRGDFAYALELLENYRIAGGDENEYEQARARFLTGGGFSNQALTVADEILRTDPYNYHAHFSRVLALKEAGRLQESLEGLDSLESIPGDARSKSELQRIIRTPLRSHLRADASWSTDSDGIDIGTVAVEGRYTVNPEFYIRAGTRAGYLDSDIGSGLDTIRGDDRVSNYSAWIGGSFAATEYLWLHGRIGQHDSNVTDSTGIFRAEAEFRPFDQLYLNAAVDRDFHMVSPRALSLDITRTNEQLRATWRPNLDYTVEVQAGYAEFSDDNERWNLALAPRRSVLRRENYNLDLGVSGRWFGFNDDLANGYYDPATYQQYLVTAFYYLKLSDEDGISVIIAPGFHKDESMDSYEFSGNFFAEGTFGLYRDWMLNMRAGLVKNIGVNNTSYNRLEAGISITRRF